MVSDIEAQLRASEMRFRALTTATSDVVYRMSPDWREMRQADGSVGWTFSRPGPVFDEAGDL